MKNQKSIDEFSFYELDRELIARGAETFNPEIFPLTDMGGSRERIEMFERLKALYAAPPPRNKEMEHLKDDEIIKRLFKLTKKDKENEPVDDSEDEKGIIGDDDRLDFYEIENKIISAEKSMADFRTQRERNPKETYDSDNFVKNATALEKNLKIKKNYDSVALICYYHDLKKVDENNEYILNLSSYKELFNLCKCERFSEQSVANGDLCTAFLVKDDVIATAGHFINRNRVKDLCIVFGFKMNGPETSVTKVPGKNVYRCTELIAASYDMNGKKPDWALLKLERKVTGQEIVSISRKKDFVNYDSNKSKIYTIGHPMGLPLKFAGGASVRKNKNEFFFSADLDVYMGNSGSPVFDGETHEVIGIVVQSYSSNYRYVGKCLVSLVFKEPTGRETSELSVCTNISSLIEALARLEKKRLRRI